MNFYNFCLEIGCFVAFCILFTFIVPIVKAVDLRELQLKQLELIYKYRISLKSEFKLISCVLY